MGRLAKKIFYGIITIIIVLQGGFSPLMALGYAENQKENTESVQTTAGGEDESSGNPEETSTTTESASQEGVSAEEETPINNEVTGENAAMEAESDMVMITPFSVTGVSTYTQLKTALETVTVTQIDLLNDITITSGINAANRNLIINGNGFTLTENSSSAHIDFDFSGKTLTINNLKMIGKSRTGTFSSSAVGTNIIYNTVTYNGPQLTSNPDGTVTFQGTSIITLVTNSQATQEVLEANKVVFDVGSNVTTSQSIVSGYPAFKMNSVGAITPVIELKQNAVVNITQPSGIVNGTSLAIIVGQGASFTANTRDFSTVSPIDSISIADDATFDVTESQSRFDINNSITVGARGTLRITGTGNFEPIAFINGGRTITLGENATLDLKRGSGTGVLTGSNITVSMVKGSIQQWTGTATSPSNIWRYVTATSINVNGTTTTVSPTNDPTIPGVLRFSTANRIVIGPEMAPVITSLATKTYERGTAVTAAQFLTDINAAVSPTATITSNILTVVNFNVAGSYTVTLNATTSMGQQATPKQVTVIINDTIAPIISTVQTAISYPQPVNKTEAQFLADITATTNDGSAITSNFSSAVNQAVTGTYTVTLNSVDASGNAATPKIITVTILPPNVPVLTVSPNVVTVNVGDVVNVLAGVSATDVESGAITPTHNGPVFTATTGVQNITYSATDGDGNTTTANRTYVIQSPTNPATVGTDYVLFADSFTKRTSQVNVANSAIISSANARAYKLSDGSAATVAVTATNGYSSAIGAYPISFNVQQEVTTTRSITATVTNGSAPVITITPLIETVSVGSTVNMLSGISSTDVEDGTLIPTYSASVNTASTGVQVVTYSVTDSDGNTTTNNKTYIITSPTEPAIVGANYVIFASSFTRRISQVNPADAAIITAANARAFKLSDGTSASVSVTQTNGYTATVGTYALEFAPADELGTKIVTTATVTNGNLPVLNVSPSVVVVNVGDNVNATIGISATDLEDGVLTITNNGPVNTSAIGVQVITYSVTDSDGNNVTKNRTYVIQSPSAPAVVGTNYVVFASSFTKRIGQVDASTVAVISAGNARAFKLSDGSVASVGVTQTNGYAPTVGVYSIEYNVLDETTTKTTIVGTVIKGNNPDLLVSPAVVTVNVGDAVVPQTGVSSTDAEDTILTITDNGPVNTATTGVRVVTYSVTDSDGNTVTNNRTYVVQSPTEPAVVGTNYVIFASAFTKRISQVDTSGPAILTAANVRAFKLLDGTVGTVNITTTSSYAPVAGTYAIGFEVVEEVSTHTTATATVTAGNSPILSILPEVVTVNVGDVVVPQAGVSSTDTEDATLTITDNGPVNTTTTGVQIVTYSVTDSDGNTVTKNRTYVIQSPTEPAVVGTDYVIFASPFTKRIGQVDTAPAAIISAANARVFKLSDGTAGTVSLVTAGGYAPTVGTYTINFRVAEETSTNTTIEATVITGNTPVIEVIPAIVEVSVGDVVNVLSGVIATDSEDGLLTPQASGTVDTSNIGVQIITYNVIDSDGNAATAQATYVVSSAEQPAVIGSEYVIFAHSFIKRIGEVDINSGAITTAANAKAFKLSDASVASVEVSQTNGYTAAVGVYPIVFAVVLEPNTKITAQATVSSGEVPVLTIDPKVVVVNVGDVVNELTGVSTTDAESSGLTPTSSGPVNTTASGVQIITYSVTDDDGNTVTGTRTYVIQNPSEPATVGATYVIFASPFTKRVGQVDTTIPAILTSANVRAYRLADGLQEATWVANSNGYSPTSGTYPITFEIQADTTTTITAEAEVIPGDSPVLEVAPTVVTVNAGDVVTIQDGVSSTDTEDTTLSITDNGPVNTTTTGVQIVTYSVTDSDGNTVTKTRTYVIQNPSEPATVGTNYVLFASPFTKRISQVDTNGVAILTAANARAFKLSDGTIGTVHITTTSSYGPSVGTYAIGFEVSEEAATVRTVDATVIAGDSPVLTVTPAVITVNIGDVVTIQDGVSSTDTEDAALSITDNGPVNTTTTGVQIVTYSVTDSDGNTVTKNRTYVIQNPSEPAVVGTAYVIFASPFTKRIGQVDTNSPAIISAANARAFKLSDGTTGTVNITTVGGYAPSPGVYTISFEVGEEPGTAINTSATVERGASPVLVVAPAVVTVNLGDTVVTQAGVSVSDTEDATLSITDNGPVNTTVTGVQVVTYTVTDSDGNTVTKNRTYVIQNPSEPATVGANYVIFASPFTKRISQVDTSTSAILTAANARVLKLEDGTAGTINITTIGGYSPSVGTYAISLEIVEEPTIDITINATVTAGNSPIIEITPTVETVNVGDTVVTQAGVSSTDTEDATLTITDNGPVNTTTTGVQIVTYSVTDSDGNTVTKNRTYVIQSPTELAVVGTDYVIFASPFTKRVGLVDTAPAAIISAANARVFKLSDGTAGTVSLVTAGGYAPTVGTYNINFKVAEETSTNTTISATVTSGNAPVIEVIPVIVEVSVGDAVNVLSGVIATDSEDGVLTPQASGTVDTSNIGVQVITYNVTDSDGNVATAQATYVISSATEPAVIGSEYVIFANSFTKRTGEVDINSGAIITAANAKAFKLSDASVASVEVSQTNGYTAAVGVYPIVFGVVLEPNTKITAQATVSSGQVPVLSIVPNVVVVNVGDVVNELSGVSATDTESSGLTPTSNGSVNTTASGIQIVTYSVTDGDGNTVTGTRSYVIQSASEPVTVSANYVIFASPFTKRVGLVDTNIPEILTAANVRAYRLTDGLPVATWVGNSGGYTAIEGIYSISYEVQADTTTTVTASATVIAGDNPVLTVTPAVVTVNVGDTVAIQDGVGSTDTEDATLSITDNGPVSTVTTGVRVVTYSVTDSDGNTVTKNRTYVIQNPSEPATVGTNYVLFASSFTKRVGQVDTTAPAILTAANARAFRLSDGATGTVNITETSGYSPNVGTYALGFEVVEEMTTTINASATVVAGASPELTITPAIVTVNVGDVVDSHIGVNSTDTEDGILTVTDNGPVNTTTTGVKIVTYSATDSDGNTVTGTRSYVIQNPSEPAVVGTNYVIFASPFTKRISQVNTSGPAILTAANVKAFKLSDGTAGTVNITTTSSYAPVAGTYAIGFEVVEEVSTHTTATATVTAGNSPILSILPEVVTVNVGDVVVPQAGVSSTDTEDATLTITDNGPVNTTTTGVQIVTYSVTDSDGNTVTKNRTYVIQSPTEPAVVGTDYVIFASPFTKRIGQVDTAPAAIISAANARVFKLSDGTAGTVSLVTAGGYAPTVGTYTINFKVAEETSTNTTISATVTSGNAPVISVIPVIVEVSVGDVVNVLSGVIATDSEDGVLTPQASGTVDTSNIGVKVITYNVIDSDGNTATAQATYVISSVEQPAVIGAEYVIFDKSFTRRIEEVDLTPAAIIAAANVKAYKLSDGSEAAVEISTTNGYTATVGVYPIVFDVVLEPSTRITAQATVSSGQIPVLSIVPNVVVVNVGDIVNELAGVSATDAETLGLIPTSSGTVNTTASGIQIITYSVTDGDGNTVTGTRTYVIQNPSEPATVGTTYVIFASPFTKRVGQVDTTIPAILTAANVRAYRLADGVPMATWVANSNGYSPTSGTYPITFEIQADTTTTITAEAEVIPGASPVLTVTPAVVTVNVGDVVAIQDGVSVTDTEDATLSITDNGPVNATTTGVQIVTYSVTDSDGNTVTKTRTYVIQNPSEPATVGTNYVLFASPFTKRISQVDTNGAAILTAANARAFKLSDGTIGTVQITTTNSYGPSVGIYAIGFEVSEEPATVRTVDATVIAGASPVLTVTPAVMTVNVGDVVTIQDGVSSTDTEDATLSITDNGPVNTTTTGVQIVTYSVTDSDGNTVTKNRTYVIQNPSEPATVGTNYVIFASPFTKRIGQVDTNSAAIISAANARAFKLSDGTVGTVNVILNGYNPSAGVYPIGYAVNEEPATTTNANATVSTGHLPILTVTPSIVTVNVGDLVTTQTGVSSTDTEDGVLTVTDNGPVNTTEIGVQIVSYSVTDSDGNTVTKNRTYVIQSVSEPAIIGANYVIFATPFTKRISEVDTNVSAIITAANAKAFKLSDGTAGTVNTIATSGYSQLVGVYQIGFIVTEEPTTTVNVNATVIVGSLPVLSVVPEVVTVNVGDTVAAQTGVTSTDTEDGALAVTDNGPVNTSATGVQIVTYTTTDSDGNVVTKNRTYVIQSPTEPVIVGTEYVIFASSFTKRIGQVDTTTAAIINAANARAFKLADGTATPVNVVSTNGYSSMVGTYTINFEAANDTTTTINAMATVITGDAPELFVDPAIVTANVGDTVITQNGVTSTDTEDGTVTITDNGPVNTTTTGIQIVTYSVTDSDGNTVTKNRTYIIVSPEVLAIIGNDYVLFVSDFTKRISEVDTSTPAIIAAANARAFNLFDATAGTVTVLAQNGYNAVAGTYVIDLAVVEESDVDVGVTALVTGGTLPVLNVVPAIITASTGDVINPQVGVTASDVEDNSLTISDSGPVDTTVAGVKIETYTVTDSDGNTVTKNRTYIIVAPEDQIIIGTDYVIFADDFIKDINDVDLNPLSIIADAKARAYKLSDGSLADVNVKATNGYGAIVGTYQIEFEVADEPTTVITTTADVTSSELAEIRVKNSELTYEKNTVKTEAEFLTEVDVQLINAIDLTSDFDSAVDFSTVGTYIVTLTATKSYTANSAEYADLAEEKISTQIIVHIVEKSETTEIIETTKPGEELPTTGENITVFLGLGFLIVLLATTILILLHSLRKRTEA